jgi:NADH-quinone oxidoreductase subunit M
MLVGILYMYFKNPEHSFALQSFYHIKLSASDENFVFCLFFIAFAIKMPIFPFHTWQPDTYEQAPTAVTMILTWSNGKDGFIWCDSLGAASDARCYGTLQHLIIILSVIGILVCFIDCHQAG